MCQSYQRQKTDKKDSKWICDLFKHDLLKSSFIPSKDIRELRDLSRYQLQAHLYAYF
ncbi:transposase [Coprobacillaceae bacterium CR2/5/TPMF4]|nr:transposase [Coprobacillaceae bacterium CR2/5/TPMF4]